MCNVEFTITFSPDQSIQNNSEAFVVMNHFKVICGLAELKFADDVSKIGGICKKTDKRNFYFDPKNKDDEPAKLQTWQEQFEESWDEPYVLGAEIGFFISELNPPLIASLIEVFTGYFNTLELDIKAEGTIKEHIIEEKYV